MDTYLLSPKCFFFIITVSGYILLPILEKADCGRVFLFHVLDVLFRHTGVEYFPQGEAMFDIQCSGRRVLIVVQFT